MFQIIIVVAGCTLILSGVIGLNLLLSGAMVRDVYLNGTFMPTIELIERTETIWCFKVDLILIAFGVLLILTAFWLGKKDLR